MANRRNHLLCFGFGYSAKALVDLLPADEWNVTGTSRSEAGCQAIREAGYNAQVFNDTTPLAPVVLDDVTHIIVSTPPGEAGDPVFAAHADDVAARASTIRWLAYLSTTGVYGNQTGDWVDETTPTTPTTERGKARLEAETSWLSLLSDNQLPVHIFRLGGIYGPGRNQIETVKSGKARRIIKPGQVFSRIHVADIAGILKASMDQPNPGVVYNLCDNEPAPPQDVVAYAAELLGVEPPPEIPFEEAEMSPMGRSFYADSKKVSNKKVREELGYKFKYPTYQDGLKSLL